MPQLERTMGWIPDTPAPEDFIYGNPSDTQILEKTDLRPYFKNEVENQLRLGSCTANACISDLEYLIARLYENNPTFSYPELSRLFAYWEARKVHNLHTVDAGSSIRACVHQLATVGVCIESLYPYFPANVLSQPPQFCYLEAAKHKVMIYERVTNLNDMLGCLSRGFPFVFGFTTYSGSMSAAAATGVMPMPTGSRGGGHAVLAVGHDQSREMFLIRNSYGKNWGTGGYYWMPYRYVTDPNLSADHWTMQALKWEIDV